jgi:hypothetical protein
VHAGPRNPVPPKINILNGTPALDFASAAALALGKSAAPAAAVVVQAINSRRVMLLMVYDYDLLPPLDLKPKNTLAPADPTLSVPLPLALSGT